MRDAAAYAWRTDPRVPAYDDSKPLIIFDGICLLCSGFAQWIITHDPDARILLTHAQSPLGQGFYQHCNLPTDTFETVLMIENGYILTKSDVPIRVLMLTGGVWKILAHMMKLCPRAIRDFLYLRIARNRYRLFGKRTSCWLPQDTDRGRIIG